MLLRECTIIVSYVPANGRSLAFVLSIHLAVMDNPMFESQSPSDFWGRRWNLLIHHCLKGAIYKPIRRHGGTKTMAVLAAFIASGLFHEWIIPCVFFDYPNVVRGRQSIFFAWQAMLVAAEAAVGGTNVVKRIQQTLPRPVRSLLVIVCGIPLGHWFLDAYVNSHFFEHGHMVFMAVLPLNAQS